jgi:predicted phosphoribosyltransferase
MATYSSFRNRNEAGTSLGRHLRQAGVGPDCLVLGLACGGAPVARAAAEELGAPWDFLCVKKLSLPAKPESAIGAVAGGDMAGSGVCVLDGNRMDNFALPAHLLHALVANKQQELRQQTQLFRAGRTAPALHGTTVVLVDDGMETGLTMLAACRSAQQAGAARVLVGIPVASTQACRFLAEEAPAVRCHCLLTKGNFDSVSEWYQEFPAVSDQDVLALLAVKAKRIPS